MLLGYRPLVKKFDEPSNYIIVQVYARQIVASVISRIRHHDCLNVFVSGHTILHEVLTISRCGAGSLFLKAGKKPDAKVTGASVRLTSVGIILPNSHDLDVILILNIGAYVFLGREVIATSRQTPGNGGKAATALKLAAGEGF